MSNKLDAYLEEIGHYLSDREAREEILKEIRAHVLDKAEREHGDTTDASIEQAIAAHGPARRVAERYFEDGPPELISPAYKRYLVRYTSLVFAVHLILVFIGSLTRSSIMVFPVFIPRMNIVETLAYLPMAFLFDLGLVGLVLYLISRSRKDVHLPWPKIGLEPERVKPTMNLSWRIVAFIALLAVTAFLAGVYLKYGTLFFFSLNFVGMRSLFTPEASRFYSLCVIAVFAVDTVAQFVRIFTPSPWVKLSRSAANLAIFALILSRSFDNPFAAVPAPRFEFLLRANFTIVIIVIAAVLTFDLVKSIVAVSRLPRKNGE